MLEPMEIITTEQMHDAMENGYEVTVIINGEYYTLQGKKENGNE